jgi:hypothetical protein
MTVTLENERLKFVANFLSNSAVVVLATGVLTPVASMAMGSSPDAVEHPLVLVLVVASLCGAGLITRAAMKVMDALIEE